VQRVDSYAGGGRVVPAEGEKLLPTDLTSTDTTERNAGMLRVPRYRIAGRATEAGRRTVTLPAAAAVALAEHLAEFAEPGPDGLVSRRPRVAVCGGPTSAAAPGCPQRGRLVWRGCGSMIFGTRRRRWRWPLGRTRGS
jgi:hypothetical protein